MWYWRTFRPGVMQRLGLGYEVCRQLRPALVYCSISGYGQSGPQRDYPAIDNIVQATSGMMAVKGEEGDPPARVGWPVVDTYTGTLAALAVLAALLQRERFGEGQYIDVAMLDASLVMLTSLATPYLVTGQMLPSTGNIGYSGSPTAAMFPARDGTQHLPGGGAGQSIQRLVPRHRADRNGRRIRVLPLHVERAKPQHAQQLREALLPIFATRDGLEWERVLNGAGAPCGLIRDVASACDNARSAARDLVQQVDVNLQDGRTVTAEYLNAGFVFAKDGPQAPAQRRRSRSAQSRDTDAT